MKISKLLIAWYNLHGRELPWRETADPYKIWVSEIILQQTRIAQGMSYYHSFLSRFPDIRSLAEADELEVLKIWQGLGYYSRARNMHSAAREIIQKRNGIFPRSYTELIGLKGIGPYTAAAISSIVSNEPKPAIDGNVKRVICRLSGLTVNIKESLALREISAALEIIFDPDEPGIFNQAMMDLGAMICTPANPKCIECPLSMHCVANKNGMVNELPVSYMDKKIRNRYLIYYIIRNQEGIMLKKRTANDIWKSLYEFPLVEIDKRPGETEWTSYLSNTLHQNIPFLIEKVSDEIKHNLSHQKIFARFIHVKIDIPGLENIFHGTAFVPFAELHTYPLPRLIEKYLEDNPI